MHSAVQAESCMGPGAFWYALPVGPPTDLRRGRVLIVDDEPGIGRTIKILLSEEHDVAYETSGAGALDRLRRGERFDVILCDIMMPAMSGIDLYGHVRTLAPDQAAAMIFLSGGAVTDRAREFLAGVTNVVIDKPFDPRELGATIRRLVSQGA
jgi:CheY-like chemotaxis protein